MSGQFVYLIMNNMKQILSFVLIAGLMACNNSEGEGNVQLEQTAQPLPVATGAVANPSDTNKVSTIPTTQQTTAALNPAHGVPGHRCDIAVGAPLNSPPNAGGAAPIQMQAPQQQTAPVMQQAPTNASGVKLNPPHGQPGHDCSIEVGKPLRQ